MARFRETIEETKYHFLPAEDYWSAEPHHVFTRNFKYEPEHVLCDKYTVADRSRELDIYVWMQCYCVESLTDLFEQNGLQVEACYSDMAGAELKDESPRIMVVATHSV